MDWGNTTKCLGKHIWRQKTRPRRYCWLKKPVWVHVYLFVCLFVSLLKTNEFLPRWIWPLCFQLWDLGETGETPRLTGQIFHISWRSWYLHSVALMYRVRDDWGTAKINSSPLKIGNPKKGKAKLSPKHQFSVASFGGGGGVWVVSSWKDGGWRMEICRPKWEGSTVFLGYCIFCYELILGGLGGDHFLNVSGVNLLESKIPPKTLHCNAWKYQRGREIRNSDEHFFFCRFKCVARISASPWN